jgi:hypothetical protein
MHRRHGFFVFVHGGVSLSTRDTPKQRCVIYGGEAGSGSECPGRLRR